ncbi:DNA polymerase III, beta subunit [Desulfatibacillum aliphaticivorans]|uniref:Beta sliding clamp n=1 Tax=Desulfatibacillum aliphaticivorans TaxID=218208 RepID=B8F8V2_DESAL|nr:DNA polymerase III subunit beta [Desulfatibacillum aliphaticivorans]ACL01984.1 DNA polymerase III, beta subunit [Desulfatibacillum aliphaticivorans]
MQLTIPKQALLRAVLAAEHVAAKDKNFPALGGIRMEAGHQSLTIQATDLDTGYASVLTLEDIQEPGAALPPAQQLKAVIMDWPEEDARLSVENGFPTITGERTRTSLAGMDPEDFPEIPEPDQADWFKVPGVTLETLLRQTLLSRRVPESESRPHMVGAHLARDGEHLVITTTDGCQLARGSFPIQDARLPEKGIILHKTGAAKLMEFAKNAPGDVALGVTSSHLSAESQNERLISRLVQGDYPDTARIIPVLDTGFAINRFEFLAALKRVGILTSEKYQAASLALEHSRITVTVDNPELGSSSETLDHLESPFDGNPFTGCWNPHRLARALAVMTSENVEVKARDAASPLVLSGEKDPGYLALVMPMKR